MMQVARGTEVEMATILPLARSAEAAARRLALRGNLPEAYRIYRQLLARPEATGHTASTWHRLAASVCLQLAWASRALKHLKLAYSFDRSNRVIAMKIANWYDAEGDFERASLWHRRARPDRPAKPILRIVNDDEPMIVPLKKPRLARPGGRSCESSGAFRLRIV
jgi:hypothetical protein